MTTRLPALFIGHGTPMNALEDNRYTRGWAEIAASFPKPKAILAISAHWYTRGLAVTAMAQPKTIHDFGGFPQALFDMQYPAPGDPALAERVRDLLAPLDVHMDRSWGLDHGTWSVLVKMYPQADIPVVQLSIDAMQPNAYHYELGRKLAALRDEGVLILASGNVVHNLRTIRWDGGEPYDWALRFRDAVRDSLLQGGIDKLIDYRQWGQDAQLAVPTPEHYLPLLYVLGARHDGEGIRTFLEQIDMGSISMMSVQVGGNELAPSLRI